MIDGNFNSMCDVFELLNRNNIKYLILRNYDNLLSDSLYVDGHGDIDMLCENSWQMAHVIGAHTYRDKNPAVCSDGTHFFIKINGQDVALDMRHIGDGYYCKKWQEDMLAKRTPYKGFYVMDKVNYLYSIIYHAIIQKPRLTDDYKKVISDLVVDLGLKIENNDAQSLIKLLETFMIANGYSYTYPIDRFVPLNKKLIDKKLIDSNFRLAYLHWTVDTKKKLLDAMVRVKHTIAQ